MSVNDDDCVKRVIKCFLYFQKEATSAMIIRHLYSVGYGIRKNYTPAGIAGKINYWNQTSKSGEWFNVESFNKNGKKYWRLSK